MGVSDWRNSFQLAFEASFKVFEPRLPPVINTLNTLPCCFAGKSKNSFRTGSR